VRRVPLRAGFCLVFVGMAVAGCARHISAPPVPQVSVGQGGRPSSCFLLYELGVGERRRAPAEACPRRVTPASTFKIAHALAALDAEVIAGPDAVFAFDGSPAPFAAWRHDHTLASAMRYSVVWYFQRLAKLLGEERERQYLARFEYGNRDASSGLETFWIGGSLLISPNEQEAFLLRLYENALPVSMAAMNAVRATLVQPPGVIVNASGEHSFASPWPDGTVLSAKTGSADDESGQSVRWLVGHIERDRRAWVFVSCAVGEHLDPLAAVDLAAESLHGARVL
jgi:beta-lactamase class D